MPSKVWIDGKLVDKNDAKVSVFDHGLLFGDGVWEGMRAYDGRVFKLREHLGRLSDFAVLTGLTLPYTTDELALAVDDALRVNNRSEGYVRLTVTRGPGTLDMDPRKCAPSVIIMAEDVVPYPRELYATGLEVTTFGTVRNHPLTTPLDYVKTLSSLDRVLDKAEAIKLGYLDAILISHEAEAIGTTEGNLFVVRGEEVRTHPVNRGAFPGITRGVILELVREAGLRAVEEPTVHADLHTADELFLTSTAAEVIGIVKIDRDYIGYGEVGPVTRRLRDLYRTAVRRPPG
jgi:branched-chain amino acid aminotransferase